MEVPEAVVLVYGCFSSADLDIADFQRDTTTTLAGIALHEMPTRPTSLQRD